MTEHERQHELKRPRGFSPGVRRTERDDAARSRYINELLKRRRETRAPTSTERRLQS